MRALQLSEHVRTRAWVGVWRLVDPKVTLASVSSMLLATALAAVDGPIAWDWLVVTVLGVLAIEAAKNASGEIFDWDSGADQAVAEADRSPFSGGKRVLIDGLLTRHQLLSFASTAYALGAAAAVLIMLFREPLAAAPALAGIVLAYFYHARPLKLAYRGLGEAAVAFVYGPLICAGTYVVQRGEIPLHVVLAAAPLGLAIGAFLLINEYPDRHADAAAGKRTLVVRMGTQRAARLFTALVAIAFLGVAALPLVGLPMGVWLGLPGVLPALAAAHRLNRLPETTSAIIPAQGWTLSAFVTMALGMSVGLLLWS